jgi:hypothetical protein
MSNTLRLIIGIVAALNVVLGWAFVRQMSWALDLWPTSTGRLTYIFIGSILIAIAAGAGWIALSGDSGAMPAGFLNLTVMVGGIGSFLLIQGFQRDDSEWLVYGFVAIGLAALNFALYLRSRAATGSDEAGDPLPRPVQISYILFTLVLLAVGGAMIIQVDGVMPWPVDADTSVLVGWIFFGNAFYFLYAVGRPVWHSSRAQLWSFLAYDVVLIWPLVDHLSTVPSDLQLNLILYIAIVVFSAALAVFYLMINPATRVWASGERATQP